MAIVEIKAVSYKENIDGYEKRDTRWRVTFGKFIVGLFTDQDTANRFVTSHLFELLVEHLYQEDHAPVSESECIGTD